MQHVTVTSFTGYVVPSETVPGVGEREMSWSRNWPSCRFSSVSISLVREATSSSVSPESSLSLMLTTRALGRGVGANSDSRGSCSPGEKFNLKSFYSCKNVTTSAQN